MRRFGWIAACLVCFLCGLTFDVDYREPYYEAPGMLRIEQEALDIYFAYLIPSAGFEKNYPERWHRWNVGRIGRDE